MDDKDDSQAASSSRRTDSRPNLWSWSAVDLADAIRRRTISSREAVLSALARCDEVNPRLNAVVDVMREEALAAADQSDRDTLSGKALGPLHGVPVTFKINVDFAGRATTDGVVAFRNRMATEDSSPVRNWKAAGAVCIGRTNVPAFSARYFTDNALHGRTLNPWAPDRTPGGSSGGAAAAVSVGIGALAHGNDRAGSVRYPAYACGVYGLRPSLGRIPGFSATGGDRTLISQLTNVQGPLARSIADIELGFNALSPYDPRDPWAVPVSPVSDSGDVPRRVALATGVADGIPVAPEVARALSKAAAALSAAGFEIEEASPPNLEETARLFFSLVKTEEGSASDGPIDRYGDDVLKRARASTMAQAQTLDFTAYKEAFQRRAILAREWQLFLARYAGLLMPVSRQLPFPVDYDQTGDAAVTSMLNAHAPLLAVSILGLPGLAVPVSIDRQIPVGVQVVSGRFQESNCLILGAVLEAEFPISIPFNVTSN